MYWIATSVSSGQPATRIDSRFRQLKAKCLIPLFVSPEFLFFETSDDGEIQMRQIRIEIFRYLFQILKPHSAKSSFLIDLILPITEEP